MGTSIYKGGTLKYHSIGQNVLITSKSYKYSNGYFGVNSPSTGHRSGNIASSDNLKTATDFYNKIALGGKEKSISENLKVTSMADGSRISFRVKSVSDGTPVVEINITKSIRTGGVKHQKIHFIRSDD